MQPININITINVTPFGVEVEQGEGDSQYIELAGGCGFQIEPPPLTYDNDEEEDDE